MMFFFVVLSLSKISSTSPTGKFAISIRSGKEILLYNSVIESEQKMLHFTSRIIPILYII